jgi:hypothetical protein
VSLVVHDVAVPREDPTPRIAHERELEVGAVLLRRGAGQPTRAVAQSLDEVGIASAQQGAQLVGCERFHVANRAVVLGVPRDFVQEAQLLLDAGACRLGDVDEDAAVLMGNHRVSPGAVGRAGDFPAMAHALRIP